MICFGEGSWALSPAFDINPQPYRQRHLKTGISELSGFEPSVEAWIEAAPLFEVSEGDARDRAAAMSRRISDRWRERLLENGVTEAQCNEYAKAFEDDGPPAFPAIDLSNGYQWWHGPYPPVPAAAPEASGRRKSKGASPSPRSIARHPFRVRQPPFVYP